MNVPHCQIDLMPDFANLPILESFIRQCPFLTGDTLHRSLLVATEYFDNIVCHSKCFSLSPVSIEIRQYASIQILMTYRTCNFRQIQRAADNTRPYFDSLSGRYRGLGLRMCHNLSSFVEYRRGLFKSSIRITL